MKNINLQHLFYFWNIVHEGSIYAAARKLNLSQPTISIQLGELEKYFKKPLFERLGKSLELTDFGKMVIKYAEDIFHISNELHEVAHGVNIDNPSMIRIGIADVIPKSIAFNLLSPLFDKFSNAKTFFNVNEGPLDKLLNELSTRQLDFIISDSPPSIDNRARILIKKIESKKIFLVANGKLANKLKKDFPKNLQNAPFLMPKKNNMMRYDLDIWLYDNNIKPQYIAEFDDTALMKEFAKNGYGFMALAGEPAAHSLLKIIGQPKGLLQHFFVIFLEKKHPVKVLEILLNKH